ncbi:hypothetical protein ILUMI_02209 [Ignelater luminosus]|uniref:Acyltransferase n=1 Tax=Ignelater luminosus TaxID=2038154 RepID=A0A8K0GL13_IGNLU|nr:hypothetical protein ILUMI_02209 [Ignelater luminosus]
MALGSIIGLLISMYLLIFSTYWLGTLLYLIWVWTIDSDTCDRGGRRLEWFRNLAWWRYMRDYFPVQLKKQPGVELDPKKNYLFCSFPHGMLSTGVFLSFGTNACGFQELFPSHKPYLLTLRQHFNKPYFREIIYSLGLCSASADSINWLLKYPGGGKAPLLVVGGVAEAFHCKPGQYILVLKNRKGFVRLAMQNGTAIVPVLAFGETDIFDQVDNPEGSYLRSFQEWFRKIAGIAPIIPVGRGFLQYSYGWVPQRRPITTIIGKPLEVQQVENPTQEQISAVHEKFMEHLTQFFEEEKHKYVENPEQTKLVIT